MGGTALKLLQAYWRASPSAAVVLALVSIAAPLASLTSPFFLAEFLQYLAEAFTGSSPQPNSLTTELWGLIGLLVCSTFAADILGAANIYYLSRAQNWFRHKIQTHLSWPLYQVDTSVIESGKITTFFTGDADNIAVASTAYLRLLQSIVLLLCGIAIAFYFLGLKALVFLALLCLATPISRWLSSRFSASTGSYLNSREQRTHILTQLLASAKTLRDKATKTYAKQRILNLRSKEAVEKRAYYRFNAISNLFFTVTDTAISAIIVLLFSAIDNRFSVEVFLPLTLLTKILQTPLGMMSIYLAQLAKGSASLGRLKNFEQQLDANYANLTKDGNTSFGNELITKLSSAQPSFKILVTSSDASQFALAINAIKKLFCQSASTARYDTSTMFPKPYLSFGPPVLIDASLKENIELFGGKADIASLENSHLLPTAAKRGGLLNWQIEPKGQNLSTGQQKRIELARADTYGADTLFLEEPFSGLDPTTAALVCQRLLHNSWAAKKVIVFSKATDLEAHFDLILTIAKDGKIKGHLHNHSRPEHKSPTKVINVTKVAKAARVVDSSLAGDSTLSESSQATAPATALAEDYAGEPGKSLLLYLKAMLGQPALRSILAMASLVGLIVAANALTIFQDFAMSMWLEGRQTPLASSEQLGTAHFGLFLLLLTGISLAVNFYQDYLWRASSVNAAQRVHNDAVDAIVDRLSLVNRRFSDKAIIQRLTQDDGILNDQVSWAFEASAYTATKTILTFLLAAAVSWYAAVPLVIAVILYRYVQQSYYRSTHTLVTKRTRTNEAILRNVHSSRQAFLMAMVSARVSAKATRQRHGFKDRLYSSLEELKSFHNAIAYQELLFSIRGGVLSSCSILLVSIGILQLTIAGKLPANLALPGVLILQLFSLNDLLRGFFDASADLQRDLSSLHRIHQLTSANKDSLTLTAKPKLTSRQDLTNQGKPHSITFNEVYARYSDAAEPVLNGFSFTAQPGIHTVIQGPSGDGKSSIFYTLWKELVVTKGDVCYGGINLSSLPLEQLEEEFYLMDARANLIGETLRDSLGLGIDLGPKSNNESSRVKIETVLTTLGLSALVQALPHGLDQALEHKSLQDGEVLKLLKIAKAFIANAQVVMLDEPLSALTPKSQNRVKRLIRYYQDKVIIITTDHEYSWPEESNIVYRINMGRNC